MHHSTTDNLIIDQSINYVEPYLADSRQPLPPAAHSRSPGDLPSQRNEEPYSHTVKERLDETDKRRRENNEFRLSEHGLTEYVLVIPHKS